MFCNETSAPVYEPNDSERYKKLHRLFSGRLRGQVLSANSLRHEDHEAQDHYNEDDRAK